MYQYSEANYYEAASQAYGASMGQGMGEAFAATTVKRSHSPDNQGSFKQVKTDSYASSAYYSAITPDYGNQQQTWAQPSGTEMIDFSEDTFTPKQAVKPSQPAAMRGRDPRGGRGLNSRGAQRGRGVQGPRGRGFTGGYPGQGGPTMRGAYNRGGPLERGRGRGRGVNTGLPPNSFNPQMKRGRRGGAQTAGRVAPVHSMSKVVHVDPSQMSIAEKIRRFCLFLQNDTIRGNAIQTIENGLMSSKLGMKTEFVSEELMRFSGKYMYTGRLSIDGVFLVRGVGSQKKEMKHEIFQKAYEILLSKTVAEIFNLVDPGVEAIRHELETSLENKKADRLALQASLNMATERMVICSNLQEAMKCIIKALHEPFKGLDNPISKLEQAVSRSHCGIKHEFKCEEVRLKQGTLMFYGKLLFLDVVVARGNDTKKKTCKAKTYQAAIDALLTKPLDALMISVPQEPREEEFKEEEEKDVKLKPKDLPLRDRFDSLIKHLAGSTYRENNISTIDVATLQYGISNMAVYRQQGPELWQGLTCELYMENYLIATGSGPKRKESMQDAYAKAWDIFQTTTADEILSQHKFLTAEEKLDPSIIDIFMKGCGHSKESNMAMLRRFNHHEKLGSVKPEEIVLMEQCSWSEDRVKHAFSILQFSATHNIMLLQWQLDKHDDTKEFMCTVYLQEKQLGQCIGPSKQMARNSACVDALFQLYQTQEVISVTRRDEFQSWIKWEDILQQAGLDSSSNGLIKVETSVSETIVNSGGTDDPGMTVVKDEVRQEKEIANPAVMKVLEKYLEDFLTLNVEPEMVFSPGMPLPVQRDLRMLARERNIRLDLRQHNGEVYCRLHCPMTPQQILQKLKENNGKFGRYELVPRSSLPKYDPVLLNLRHPKPKPSEVGSSVKGSGNSGLPPVNVEVEGYSF